MNDPHENSKQGFETNGPRDNLERGVESSHSSTMTIRPVRQSASKEHFLQALDLNLARSADRLVFTTMWEEVTQYWVKHFETTNREILKPEYASNPGVKQPYKWGHLNGEAIHRAIDEIIRFASERSYRYYLHGRSADQTIHNWVLKWLLWHVARYRDERNNKKNRTPDGSTASSSPGHESIRLAIRERGLSDDENRRNGHPTNRYSQEHSGYWHTVMDGKP